MNTTPMQEQDWKRLRQDFPALQRFHYFYTASGGPLPLPVYQELQSYYRDCLENGDYHWERNLARREDARRVAAEFIHAEPDEIEFVPNTSTGMNLLASMLASRGKALTGTLEFPSTTLPWLHHGSSVNFVEPEADGAVPPEKIAAALTPDTAILLTSHVQFSNGFRQDLEQLGRLKGERYLIVNATQSLGAFEIDVKNMQIDALCCTGYKWLLAGYGAGLLYVSKRILAECPSPQAGWFNVMDRDALDNRRYAVLDSAARFSPGSPTFPCIVSLGASLRYLGGIGRKSIEQRVLQLNQYFTDQLQDRGIPFLSPIRPEKHRSAQTLVKLKDPAEATALLEERRILCTRKPEGIRVATHFFVDKEDIDILVDALVEISR